MIEKRQTNQTLEQRIAATLGGNGVSSSTAITDLIVEVNGAIAAADEQALNARQAALDPTAVIDAAKASAAIVAAELSRDRLRNALPQLHDKFETPARIGRSLGRRAHPPRTSS
jgi:hypothetical protein